MPDRRTIIALDQVSELRHAQKVASATALLGAIENEEVSRSARDHQVEARNQAEAEWSRMLGDFRPDPELLRLGGAWLVEQQAQLQAEELNLSIAEGQTERARQDHAGALARESAIETVSSKARKRLECYLFERQETRTADHLLREWVR